MASAEAIAKLETKAVAAEKLIELLRQQISQVGQVLNKLGSKILVVGEGSPVWPGWQWGSF
jgi:hypothetical protein